MLAEEYLDLTGAGAGFDSDDFLYRADSFHVLRKDQIRGDYFHVSRNFVRDWNWSRFVIGSCHRNKLIKTQFAAVVEIYNSFLPCSLLLLTICTKKKISQEFLT